MYELKSIAIIPARFGSTRFPGKPLAKIFHKTMIQYVYERVAQARGVAEVLVATDDLRILEAVVSFGGKACMTSANHRSGTDRVAEAAKRSDAELIVNVQGDEPLIDPRCIEAVMEPLYEESELMISTLKSPESSLEDLHNPNVVKVVTDRNDYALYFSRSPIPYQPLTTHHGESRSPAFFRHIGLYGYRRKFLELLPGLKESDLEKAEALEQLRFLENGFRIKVVQYNYQAVAVDTPEDMARVNAILEHSVKR